MSVEGILQLRQVAVVAELGQDRLPQVLDGHVTRRFIVGVVAVGSIGEVIFKESHIFYDLLI